VQRPTVLVNMAVTADGKIDTVERRGARISGPADTLRVDRLRAAADAVMVGGRTLVVEDPRLTVRDPELIRGRVVRGRPPQPAKVAVATRLVRPGHSAPALPATSRFLLEGSTLVIVATTSATPPDARQWLVWQGAQLIVHDAPRVDLAVLLAELGERGIRSLMVEGGGTLVAALLEAGLVDELQLAIAPLLFGGEDAPTPVGGAGWPLSRAMPLRLLGSEVDADDVVVLRYAVGAGQRP
jgi:2,5-diamino-6-(ribosylamino)-4(3H)-pyrimidinone 5'-phosphate reductase